MERETLLEDAGENNLTQSTSRLKRFLHGKLWLLWTLLASCVSAATSLMVKDLEKVEPILMVCGLTIMTILISGLRLASIGVSPMVREKMVLLTAKGVSILGFATTLYYAFR